MILGYILSFSILVMSVIKVTGIFTTADENLKEIRQEFIKATKNTHRQGNITLMGALLTLMISALLMFFALKFKVELQESRYRKDSYLCFHYLNIQTENYVSDMTKFNWALRAAFMATLSGVATAKAKILWDGLKLVRDGRHLQYLKSLSLNKYCLDKISAISYLKNLPYETSFKLILATNPDATTKLRKPKWNITYYQNPRGIRLKNSFCLMASFELESAFSTNLKLKTQELGKLDFSKLKCWSGYL